MDLDLQRHTVLVTGASGGIGHALAEAFAAEGARVVLHGHTGVDALAAWVASRPWADRALVVVADVRDADAVRAMFDAAAERFGRVDVAVANAGVWPAEEALLHELSVARIRDTIDVDLLGAMWTARAWMADLATRGPSPHGAALCLVGSTAGRFGELGHVDYAVAKSALRGLCLTLKNEVVHLDPTARVNLVEPGWTRTEMARAALAVPGNASRAVRTMPLRQLARPEDVARAVVFLCSPVARHVTGEVLTVAGGMEGRVRWEAEDVDEDAVREG